MKNIIALVVVLILGFLIGSFTGIGNSIFSFLGKGTFSKNSNQSSQSLTDSAKNVISEITSNAQKQTGAIFDKQYLDAMITMYEGSVALSKIGTVAAGHAEIRSTAKIVAKDDAATLAQLKKWRTEWFPEETTTTAKKPPFINQ